MGTASSDADDIEDLSDSEAEEDLYNSQNVRTEDIPMAVHGNLIQNNKSKMLHKASENDKWKTLSGSVSGELNTPPTWQQIQMAIVLQMLQGRGKMPAAKRRRLAP